MAVAIPIGGEVGWWCPSLDIQSQRTTTLRDIAGGVGSFSLPDASMWVIGDDGYELAFNGSQTAMITLGPVQATTQAFSFSWWQLFPIGGGGVSWSMLRNASNWTGWYSNLSCVFDNSFDGNWSAAGTSFNSKLWVHRVLIQQPGVRMQSYVNGVVRESNSLPTISASDVRFALGSSYRVSPDNYFAGSLDDLRYFNRILSFDEVLKLGAIRGSQPVRRFKPISRRVASGNRRRRLLIGAH